MDNCDIVLFKDSFFMKKPPRYMFNRLNKKTASVGQASATLSLIKFFSSFTQSLEFYSSFTVKLLLDHWSFHDLCF